MSLITKLGYGTGRGLNDMFNVTQFTYVFFLFHVVIRLDSSHAGIIGLVGQIADSLFNIWLEYYPI